MSTGGIFILITNDGKQDKLLMATEYLSGRIADIKAAKAGMDDDNPTLADIERSHVLFVNAHFKPFAAVAYEYNKVSLSNATLGSQLQFSIPQFGDFFNDMVVNITLATPTASATGTPANASDVPIWRYCDYPGERLFKRVSFDVNGNPLDEYYNHTYVMHRQYKVGADKITGWNKCVGQSISKDAYYQYNQSVSTTAPLSAISTFKVQDGQQVYAATHPNLNLFIPLLFWFNTDPALSIPSVAIPYGQRFITIDLESPANLLRCIINPASTTALTLPTLTTPAMTTCDLYINNLFVNPDIHDIYIKRIGFSLIRVHRCQIQNLNKSSDQILLQQLKWPITTIWTGLRPTANITSNTNFTTRGAQTSIIDPNMEDWHRFGMITTTNYPSTNINGLSTNYTVKDPENHVTNLSIVAHGIPLYNNLPADFFNCYIPVTYGGPNIVTPTDPGLFMLPFCLYPGSYQPSGHVNVSRAREFYLYYTSTYITSSTTADLIVNAEALNFLLISDGSAILRYTT
jgi:hypothetical protein